eukprot:3876091-Rhodomonas_salina.2
MPRSIRSTNPTIFVVSVRRPRQQQVSSWEWSFSVLESGSVDEGSGEGTSGDDGRLMNHDPHQEGACVRPQRVETKETTNQIVARDSYKSNTAIVVVVLALLVLLVATSGSPTVTSSLMHVIDIFVELNIV